MTATVLVQDEEQATYESWARAKDARIDWSAPAGKVYDLIRGCNPQPGANTIRDGETLKLFDSSLGSTDTSDAEPGTVIVCDGAGFEMARTPGKSVPAGWTRSVFADMGKST